MVFTRGITRAHKVNGKDRFFDQPTVLIDLLA